jgi:hypothetical protein
MLDLNNCYLSSPYSIRFYFINVREFYVLFNNYERQLLLIRIQSFYNAFLLFFRQ